jgi:uncharacterized protein (DUF2141 family)
MGQRYLLSFSLILILASCAQVGSISGGPKDEAPPRIIENGLQPENGTLNFNQKTIEFKFDEFIRLNKPAETITIIPNDAKVTATVLKKNMLVTIDGDLKPETTYAIYFNRTVQDISEGNDSLMQYVFSTGSFIDSLTYTGFIIDAWTYKPEKDMYVGLYDQSDSSIYKRPAYFSRTDVNGKFNFSYLKAGTYQVHAFDDKNRDSKWSPVERVAFQNQLLKLDSSIIDSIPMRIYTPKGTRRIQAFVNGPSLIKIASNKSLDSAKYYLDNVKIKAVNHRYNSDSVSIYFDHEQRTKVDLVVVTKELTDTISLRISERDRIKKPDFETNLVNGKLPAGENLQLRFTDQISKIDTTYIQVITKDTLKVDYEINQLKNNQLELSFDPTKLQELDVKFLKGSLVFKNNGDFLSSTVNIKTRSGSEYGILTVTIENQPEYAIIEMLQNNQVVERFKNQNTVRIENLDPGEYTFRAILDTNKNGRWDGGDFDKGIQPEEVIFFSKPVKVRANWEMEVILMPDK